MLAKMEVNQEGMEALMDASLEMTEACVQKIEANRGKVETKMESCLEETSVETIGALEDRCGDPKLAVGRRRKLKKRTQGHHTWTVDPPLRSYTA
jgi:hypothetical protein